MSFHNPKRINVIAHLMTKMRRLKIEIPQELRDEHNFLRRGSKEPWALQKSLKQDKADKYKKVWKRIKSDAQRLKNKKKYKRRWYVKNKANILNLAKIRRLKNRDEINRKKAEYREKNKERIKEYYRQYEIKNKEKRREYQKIYQKNYRLRKQNERRTSQQTENSLRHHQGTAP